MDAPSAGSQDWLTPALSMGPFLYMDAPSAGSHGFLVHYNTRPVIVLSLPHPDAQKAPAPHGFLSSFCLFAGWPCNTEPMALPRAITGSPQESRQAQEPSEPSSFISDRLQGSVTPTGTGILSGTYLAGFKPQLCVASGMLPRFFRPQFPICSMGQ